MKNLALCLLFFIISHAVQGQGSSCAYEVAAIEEEQENFTSIEAEIKKIKDYLLKKGSGLTPDCRRRLHSMLANLYQVVSLTDSAEAHFKHEIKQGFACGSDTAKIFALLDYARFLSRGNNVDALNRSMDSALFFLNANSRAYNYSIGNEEKVFTSFNYAMAGKELSQSLVNDLAAKMPDNIKYLWRMYYATKGSALIFSETPQLALRYLTLALFFDRANPTDSTESVILNNMALLYQNDGNHTKAVELFQYILAENNGTADELAQINTLINISYSFRMIKQYAKAREFTTKAVALAEKLKAKSHLCRALSAMASVFIEEKKYAEAEKLLRRSMDTARAVKDDAELCYTSRKLGYMLIEFTDRLPEGKVFIDSSRYLAKKIGDDWFSYYIDYSDANYFFKTGNSTLALNWCKASYAKSIQVNDKEYILLNLNLLSKIYTGQNNYKAAFEYYKMYETLKDSTTGKEMQLALAELQEKYDDQARQVKIEKLEKDNRDKIRQTRIYVAAAIAMLLLAALFFYFNRQLKAGRKILLATNEQLAAFSATQNRLFGIISHDLKGMIIPFQRAGKILSHYLGKNDFDNARQFALTLEDNATRLSGTLNNLLLWSLQQMQGLKIKKESINVADAVNHIADHYKDALSFKNILFSNNIHPGDVLFTDREAFQVIARNLLSNAIKFTENQSIIISARNSDANYIFEVADHGTGMPARQVEKLFSFAEKNTSDGTRLEKGTGLGLVVVKKLAEALDGEVTINSAEGKGTTVSINFRKTNSA